VLFIIINQLQSFCYELHGFKFRYVKLHTAVVGYNEKMHRNSTKHICRMYRMYGHFSPAVK